MAVTAQTKITGNKTTENGSQLGKMVQTDLNISDAAMT